MNTPRIPSYFVTMIDYGRDGRQAVVDPEVTRREVISRVASGEYKNILFIHHISADGVEDVTDEILEHADLAVVLGVLTDPPRLSPSERLEAMRDHCRKLRAESV